MNKNNIILTLIVLPLGFVAGYFFRGAWSVDSEAGRAANGANVLHSSAAKSKADMSKDTRRTPKMHAEFATRQGALQNTEVVNGYIDEHPDQQRNQSQPATDASYNYAQELSLAIESSDGDDRAEELIRLFADWTSQDLDAAHDWLVSQEYSAELDELYYQIAIKHIERDIESAGDIVAALPNGNSKQNLISEYSYQLATIDPYKAIAWSNNLVDPELREDAQLQSLKAWAESSPVQVLDYITSASDLPEHLRNEIVTQAASDIGKQDHELISSSIAQYPRDLRPQIAYGLIGSWVENDPDGARGWVASLQKGETKDKAIQSYIDYGSEDSNTDEKFKLTETIIDQSARVALMSRVFEEWYFKDPNQAEVALNATSSLNDTEKGLLLGRAKLQ